MASVWALRLPPSEKFVLLALADNANDDGTCWPSVSTISGKTSLAERTVRGVIHRLQRTGYVSIEERYGRSHVFTITPASAAPLQALHPALDAPHPGSKCTPTPASAAPTPASAAPITIKEPSVESSREPSSEALTRRGDARKRKPEVLGTRIAEPFDVTAEMTEWAARKAPGVDIAAVTEEFVDYWKGVPGQRGRKTDWQATWRNRMRDKVERKAQASRPRKTRFEELTEHLNVD